MSNAALDAKSTRSVKAPAEVREAVVNLMVDYAIAIDNDCLESWPDFFVEDCLYRIIGRSDYDSGRRGGFVYCDNQRMLIDRVHSLRAANVYQPHLYRHLVSASKITATARGTIHAETNFAVIRTSVPEGEMSIFSAGRYIDEVVMDGQLAKLRSRTVVTDSDAIDILLVIPI